MRSSTNVTFFDGDDFEFDNFVVAKCTDPVALTGCGAPSTITLTSDLRTRSLGMHSGRIDAGANEVWVTRPNAANAIFYEAADPLTGGDNSWVNGKIVRTRINCLNDDCTGGFTAATGTFRMPAGNTTFQSIDFDITTGSNQLNTLETNFAAGATAWVYTPTPPGWYDPQMPNDCGITFGAPDGSTNGYAWFLNNGYFRTNARTSSDITSVANILAFDAVATGGAVTYNPTLHNRGYSNAGGAHSVFKRPNWPATGSWTFNGYCVNTSTAARSMRLGVTGFSDHITGATETNDPFAVKGLQANATPRTSTIFVDWTTDAEEAVGHFELERTTDMVSFDVVHEAEPLGKNGGGANYGFDDRTVEFNTKYYYRVKQVGLDGGAMYSNTVEASLFESDNLKVAFYPNPTNGVLFVTVDSPVNGLATVRVLNTLGQEVMTINREMTVGEQAFEIDLSGLAVGTYQVNLRAGDAQFTEKVVRVK